MEIIKYLVYGVTIGYNEIGPFNIEFIKTFYNINAVLTVGSGHRDYFQNAFSLKFV